jgi:hypothetical protein
MKPLTYWSVVFFTLAGLTFASEPPQLKKAHEKVLSKWLKSHPILRIADVSDCGDCGEEIEWERREKPDFHPYYVVGDFNQDGRQDFAVALIDKTKSKGKFTLVIFNKKPILGYTPAFIAPNLFLENCTLAFNEQIKRLVFGYFRSEGVVVEPQGKGYRIGDALEEGL